MLIYLLPVNPKLGSGSTPMLPYPTLCHDVVSYPISHTDVPHPCTSRCVALYPISNDALSSIILFLFFFSFLRSSFWTSHGHRCRPFPRPDSCLQLISRIGLSKPTARRFFHRALLTHALALSASQFVHTKKSLRIYKSMHSGGLELTKLTYTRLEDNNLIRHRGHRHILSRVARRFVFCILYHAALSPALLSCPMVPRAQGACVVFVAAQTAVVIGRRQQEVRCHVFLLSTPMHPGHGRGVTMRAIVLRRLRATGGASGYQLGITRAC